MGEYNLIQDEVIFNNTDRDLVRAAILGTIADFDPESGTVIQPNFTVNSHLITKILALADLGVPGMNGSQLFIRDTDNLFLEENLDVARLLSSSQRLSNDDQSFLKKRIIDWNRRQRRFAQGRFNKFPNEIAKLPVEVRETTRDLFCFFGETIQNVEVAIRRRERLDCQSLLFHCGYHNFRVI